jgi:8-oxo-dGTP pyrophosphatase MutT (NUDIX family)
VHPAFDSLQRLLAARVAVPDPDAGLRQAAVAVVCVPQFTGLEVLLIRRAEREGDPWSGQMGLPGGHRESADLDLVETAIRETREELGFDLRSARALGMLEDLRPVIRPMAVRPYVFGLDERPRVVPGAEVSRVVWARLDVLARSTGTAEVFHHGEWRTMPCFRLGEDVVWGMTYRVLQPLVAAL